MADPLKTWKFSHHNSFRFLPSADGASERLRTFLECDGLTKQQVLLRLPYARERSATPGRAPDARRYRDVRSSCQLSGLAYEGTTGKVHVTDLGKATLRLLPTLTEHNATILAPYAANALAHCQLINPTGDAKGYDSKLRVFPFGFIWKAMLELDNELTTEELARELARTRNAAELDEAIERIREARESGSTVGLRDYPINPSKGEPVIADRFIPWMTLASFGWVLIRDKRYSETKDRYSIPPHMRQALKSALATPAKHRAFDSIGDYVEFISRRALLPPDLRGGD